MVKVLLNVLIMHNRHNLHIEKLLLKSVHFLDVLYSTQLSTSGSTAGTRAAISGHEWVLRMDTVIIKLSTVQMTVQAEHFAALTQNGLEPG